MKNLTKLSLVLAVFVFTTQVNAQLRYGVKGGLNFTNVAFNYAIPADEIDTQLKPGFYLGAVVSYPINDMLNFESGLVLSTKGFNYNHKDEVGSGATVTGYDRSTITYLIIPLHVTYDINQFQIGIGPYVGFGLSGKRKYDYTIQDGGLDRNFGEEKYVFMSKVGPNDVGNNEIPIKGLDVGLDFSVGYMVSDILKINAELGLGLTNLTPEITDEPNFNPADYKTMNRAFSIGVSYFLGE